jgi:hypothetical protein
MQPIRGLAKQIEAGEAREVLEREYDYIDPHAFDFAVAWTKANPRPLSNEARALSGSEPAVRADILLKRSVSSPW